ncbi:hypothetical protein HZC30_03935 [Candidatus Woesearchaeota archaeon]|nr:hypothetical protein [Candidatus Woesearchaeota archaeon]
MKHKFVKSDRIKINILNTLKETGKPFSYYQLTKCIKTTWNSLVPNCYFLSALDLIKITEGSSPGMKFKNIWITKKGVKALDKLTKSED